jgi:hypothetical protein
MKRLSKLRFKALAVYIRIPIQSFLFVIAASVGAMLVLQIVLDDRTRRRT